MSGKQSGFSKSDEPIDDYGGLQLTEKWVRITNNFGLVVLVINLVMVLLQS